MPETKGDSSGNESVPSFDKKEAALCGVDGCEEMARYVETGDGHAVSDPKKRCEGHHSNRGLWTDMAWQVAKEFYL